MRFMLFFAVLMVATVSASQAENCGGAMNQADLNSCAAAASEKSDDELNALYQKIKLRLRDEVDSRSTLVAAQRAWVRFRDAECKFATSAVSGG